MDQGLTDPAIVAAAQRKDVVHHQQPTISKGIPSEVPFPTPIISVTKVTETQGEGDEAKEVTVFVPSVIWRERVVLHTIDDKLCSIPRPIADQMPGVKEHVTETEGDVIEFAYPASSLAALTSWIETKGFDGKTNDANFHVPVTHTDFSHLLSDKWEKAFWQKVLLPDTHTSTESVFGVINYAEKYGMDSLLQFSIIALSCEIRGESEDSILHTMGHTELSKEEKEAAYETYPWLKDDITPK